VVVDFSGGTLSSDGGAPRLRQVDTSWGLTRSLAACFRDGRDQRFVEHALPALLAQRIHGLALGYEDLNDHNQLQRDPVVATACGKPDPLGQDRSDPAHRGCPLSSAATLNRLELSNNQTTRAPKLVLRVSAAGTTARLGRSRDHPRAGDRGHRAFETVESGRAGDRQCAPRIPPTQQRLSAAGLIPAVPRAADAADARRRLTARPPDKSQRATRAGGRSRGHAQRKTSYLYSTYLLHSAFEENRGGWDPGFAALASSRGRTREISPRVKNSG
jgi:hypothetical protein